MKDATLKQEKHRQEGDPKVIPSARRINYAGHHWLTRVDYDGHRCGSIVLQWQPQARRWCLPDDYARGNDFDVSSYEYLSPCAMATDSYGQARLDQVIRDIDKRFSQATATNPSITNEEWDVLRDRLLEFLP